MGPDSKLDFAYRYPFSDEARGIVAKMNAGTVDSGYLQAGVDRLKSAFKEGKVPHEKVRGLESIKNRGIAGYVYARMLVSAIGDSYSISRFAAAEAKTAFELLSLDSTENLLRVAEEVGLSTKKENGGYAVPFETFIAIPKSDEGLRLINQNVAKGVVRLDELQLRKLVGSAVEKAVASRLPIERKELPKEVVEAARELKPQEQRVSAGMQRGAYSWIERLLTTPIHDVRHRGVNLIFAPYLVNVKGLDEEKASQIIIGYIERCKLLNPQTKINATYIRYQCRYAKAKGLRPLSLVKARELLKGVAEFE